MTRVRVTEVNVVLFEEENEVARLITPEEGYSNTSVLDGCSVSLSLSFETALRGHRVHFREWGQELPAAPWKERVHWVTGVLVLAIVWWLIDGGG